MSSKLSDTKVDFENAFNSIGYSIMKDEDACKLLAWLLEYGSCHEDVVHNPNLNADIRIAQKKLNIYGGEVPNIELLSMFQNYIKEIKKTGIKTEWIIGIFKKYNIKIPK